MVRFLLNKGASIDVGIRRDWWPVWTLLHGAIWENRIALAQLLLNHDLDVDSLDTAGRTPLHIAVIRPIDASETDVQLLLANGASIDIRDGNGDTPLNLAVWNNSETLEVSPNCF